MNLLEKMNQQAATQVELSTKNSAKAESGGAPAPTIASLFQAKAQKDANGSIAGAFVAGPDQPWNSRWVFGADMKPTLESMNAAQLPGGKPAVNLEQLKKLVANVQAQGGDETQLKAAAESTMQELNSAIAALGGEIESVRTEAGVANPKGQMNSLGGAEYLAALQGVKSAPNGNTNGDLSGQLGGGMGEGGSDAALAGFAGKLGPNGKPIVLPGSADSAANAAKSLKAVTNAKPDLQVIPGGMASAGEPLVGGLKLSKEEPKLTNTDSFMGAAPLSQVHRNADQTVGIPPQIITGHVVPGTMQRDRLTSESVRNMANSISGLTPNGGGEMRIKMNPGNLGELMIRVSTNGKDVGLKVEATDSSAKKIIEESLGALRDSLAGQSLALGRVDVSISTKDTATTDNGSNSQHSSQSQGGTAFDTQAGMQNRSNGRSYGGEENSSSGADRASARVASSRIATLAAAGSPSRNSSTSDSSRLDVMA